MQTTAETCARFLPDHLIRRHCRAPAPPSAPCAECVRGAVLMADIIGYTALTERYARRAEGVEELKVVLNDFFGRLNTLILDHGGDIVSFAGDSVFALWDGGEAAPMLAAQCALAAQRALDRSDLGEGLLLRMRIVVAAGDVTLATVGGHAGQWHCLMTGASLAAIGAGLGQTEPGEVLLESTAARALGAAAECEPRAEGYALLRGLRVQTPLPPPAALSPDADAVPALRCYIAAPVLEQLDAGHADWLGEYRRATTLFVRAALDGDALAPLQAATLAVQNVVARFEGTFHRVIVDDKGSNILCVWGIPGCAHEDDPARTLSAALAIQLALRDLKINCGIGVTTGRLMCGLSGGGRRYEYTVAGDAVNLAARLMVAAGDDILCDEATMAAARGAIDCEALPAIHVKGRIAALPVWRPHAESAAARRTATVARFLGRRREVEALRAQLRDVQAGRGAVTVIEGEPGVGKSQLVAELKRAAAAAGVGFLLGHADAIERATTYFAWREILRQILDRHAAHDDDARRAWLEALCAPLPAVQAWLPLLNDVLPLGFYEPLAIRRMSEQARAESTLELLLHLLHEATVSGPVVIVLEDAHWLDSMSWILAARLKQREAALLLVLVTRSGYAPDGNAARELTAAAQRLNLATFSREDAAALVCDRLGVDALPDELLSLIYERTDGHPLFSEELAYSLRDSGYLVLRERRCLIAGGDASVDVRDLPATVEGIIASRVDRLGAGEQLTLKVASVLGHGFAASALRELHPMRPDAAALARQLDQFIALDLVHVEVAGGGIDYRFKHIITQEVTYGLMAFAQRRQLHRVAAGWFERAHAADLSAAYPLLAHHWTRAADAPNAFRFLHLAGEQAFRRYANREAAAFLDEALALQFEAPPAMRAACERLLGFSRLWLGHVEQSAAHIRNSLAALGQRIPQSRAQLALGTLWQLALSVRNHFLGRRFIKRDRAAAAPAGFAESMIRYSHIAWFRADIPLSFYMSLRCLNLAERAQQSAETALIYGVLTNGAGALPAHGLARRYRDLALQGARALGEPGIDSQVLLFVSLYEAGCAAWADCMERVARAERLSREIGDVRRAEECTVILGYLHLHTGDIDAAQRCYENATASARRRGDRQTMGWGLLGCARVQLRRGRPERALAALQEAAPTVSDRLGGVELHGLLALACLRGGDPVAAVQSARAGLQTLLEARPVSFTTLTGTAGVVESLMALSAKAGGRDRALADDARLALKLLRRFARIFPLGEPHYQWLQGREWLAAGRSARALKCWQRAADAAARLQMPYDEALAWQAIAQHATGSAATVAHARAAALYETLGLPEAPPLP